jgi:hypothetical protein
MVLKSKQLDLPILQANKFNARMSEKLCEEILHKYIGEEDLTTRIRHIILRVPGKFPDETTVADALAVSGRTMRRQLSALGTSYRELLDQVRSDLAQQFESQRGASGPTTGLYRDHQFPSRLQALAGGITSELPADEVVKKPYSGLPGTTHTGTPKAAIAARILGQVLLVIILSVIEFRGRQYL